MRILLINHYAGSDLMGMEYRPFYFAREWVADGHDVTILGAEFSHLRASQPKVRADLDTSVEEGVRFRWLRTNRYAGSGMARVANMAMFAGKLLTYAHRIAREERPDLVICSSTFPLDIYGGARIAAGANARLVFEVHDLWPLTPMLLGGYALHHPYIRLLQHAEDLAYRRADKVVSILPDACDYMVTRGMDRGKFTHIPNGVPVSRIASAEHSVLPGPLAELVETERRRGRFLIGYAGGITRSMAIDTLIDAAQHVADRDVAFFIVGDGPDAESMRNRVAARRLSNVHMPGRIPKSSVPAFLASMDALAIPWRRSELYRYGVSPNKLFDYMLAARPILQSSDASNDLVTQGECGMTTEPENPLAFAAAIVRLRELPGAERRRLGENGRRFVMGNHDCQKLARRFLQEAMGEFLAATSMGRTVKAPSRPRAANG